MSQLHWLFWVFSLHLADRAVIRCGGGGGGPLLAKWFIYRSCYQQHVNAQMNHTKITANAGKSHEAAAVIWAQTVVLEHAVAEAAFVIFWGWFLIWFLIWMNDNVVIKGCGGSDFTLIDLSKISKCWLFSLCSTAPSTVSIMHQVSRTVDSITLSWSQPDQPNGVILDYELQYYEKVLSVSFVH